jgi:hypothetical protein
LPIRRLARHLQRQDWSALLLELVVVVVGIFLAFQVDRWNVDRKLQSQGFERISALTAEFSKNRESLEFYINRGQRVADSVMTLLALGDKDPETISHDQFYTLLAGVDSNPTFQAARSAFDVLIATGEIDLIENTNLKRRLSEFYTQVDWTQNRDRQIAQRVSAFEPYVKRALDHNALMKKVHAAETERMPPELPENQFRQVIGSPEFEAEIGAKWHTARDYQAQLKRLRALVLDIEKELTDAAELLR